MLCNSRTFSTKEIEGLTILRDDLLPGGTKRRALVKWLPKLNQNHFIYAGSVYGSGGWALAEACKDLGYKCTLALSKSKFRPSWLDMIDCEVIWHEAIPVDRIYKLYERDEGLLPLGYNEDGFKISLAEVFRETDITPSEIWFPCVSGVLLQAAQIAWPNTKLNAVCVARYHGEIGSATKYQADEKYHQPAKEPPPYPSNPFSDAKLWQFTRQFALKDSLIWNTSS